MADKKMAARSGLRLSWVPVRDQRGRVHMEAHWTADPVPAQRGRHAA